MEEVKNILLQVGGESVLVYTLTLTIEDVCKYAELVLHEKPTDAYEVKQDELQYYCIDGRVYIDTPEKETAVLNYIK